MVIAAAGAGIGASLGGDPELPAGAPGGGSGPSPDGGGDDCYIETQSETATLIDAVERIGDGSQWTYLVDAAPGDTIHLDVKNVAGVRPAVTVLDPGSSPLLETGSDPRITEDVSTGAAGGHLVVLTNLHDSRSGLWEIVVEQTATNEVEVCP